MKYLYPVKLGAITSCLLVALLTTSQTNAREVCQLLESDSDGDGWGWEMDASCRVTPETGNVPAFQHPRTGLDVNIERIFWVWDDFAGKTISECKGYIVDPGSPSDRCSTCADTESTYQHMTDGAGLFQILSGARDTTVVTTIPGRTVQTGQPSASAPAQVGMSRAGNESQSVDNSSAIDNSASNSSASNSRNGTTGTVSNTSPAGSQTDSTQATNTQLTGGTTGNAAMVNQGTRQVLASANFRWNVDNNGLYSGALPIEAYGERTAQGVRFWQEGIQGQIGFYTFCETTPSSMGPVTINNQTPVVDNNQTLVTAPQPACTDTDGDGWGWNGFDTCIP